MAKEAGEKNIVVENRPGKSNMEPLRHFVVITLDHYFLDSQISIKFERPWVRIGHNVAFETSFIVS